MHKDWKSVKGAKRVKEWLVQVWFNEGLNG